MNRNIKKRNLKECSLNVALRPQRPQGLIGTGSPGRPPQLSHSSWALIRVVHCCFTSTETTRTNRDGEPRTATSTFTQPLRSKSKIVSLACIKRRNSCKRSTERKKKGVKLLTRQTCSMFSTEYAKRARRTVYTSDNDKTGILPDKPVRKSS